jgi:dTDP-4-amino-4,6-dideoxygalactose transaminase
MPRPIALALPETGEDEVAAVRDVLSTGWLTQGPKVAEFEKRFAERIGVPFAVAVSSATTGLHLALLGLGVGPGDEVIVPSFTWVATANAVVYCGARPVFADIDGETYNLDIGAALALVGPRTKAIVAVHQFGRCVDVEALKSGLPRPIPILEDAACAAGASSGGREAGAIGDAGVFSFHPRKSITTGEGGMITTFDSELAERLGRLRSHGGKMVGPPSPYAMPEIDELGFNYRLTDIQAAIGLVQLAKLDRYISERSERARWYRERLGGLNWLHLPSEPENGRHAWQSFVARVAPDAPVTRNALMKDLASRSIGTRPGTHAVHDLGYYRHVFGTTDRTAPVSAACAATTIALPLHNRMTADDYERVADAILAAGKGGHR